MAVVRACIVSIGRWPHGTALDRQLSSVQVASSLNPPPQVSMNFSLVGRDAYTMVRLHVCTMNVIYARDMVKARVGIMAIVCAFNAIIRLVCGIIRLRASPFLECACTPLLGHSSTMITLHICAADM